MMRPIHPDLKAERQKVTFDSKEFTNWWYGGSKQYEERKALEKAFFEDPNFQDDTPISYMSQKELYEHCLRKAVLVAQKMRNLRNTGEDGVENYKAILGGSLGAGLLKEGNPMSVHFVMFLPTIMGQGTIEQQMEWLPKAWNLEIIGTYAQTELGHGTFIRGLETRADYDANSQEFILNSPTLTAYKWWPGGLGQTVNYAVIVAQLYTHGKYRGLAPFIVQVRDEVTHMPLPGIDIGDIGSKLGMKSGNNGYLGLKNVRIPLKQMLMKNQQVLSDGTYVPPKNSVLTYGTMMFVRVVILRDAALSLAKGVTIATRYSAVRRQSPINPQNPEPQILDHVTQQFKLFPQIAKAIVIKMASDGMWNMYNNVSHEVEKGSLDRLPEMHALSCCLKAICSADAATGIEVCRLACGGHGYMDCSNFPTLYGMATAACTYEGENTVMLLQTARYLVKVYGQALTGVTLVPTMSYIREATDKKKFVNFDGTPEAIVGAFQFVAANKIRIAYDRLERYQQRGCSMENAANKCGIELTKAAELHGRAYLAYIALSELKCLSKQASPGFKDIINTIIELYLVDACLQHIGDFLRFIDLTNDNITQLELRLLECLKRLRPNAVSLVDAFDLHDRILDSALGCFDGQVYGRIFEAAKKNPLNMEPVNSTFHKYLKPLMKSKL